MANSRICVIDGCGKPQQARGLCKAHYLRLLKYGAAAGGGPMRVRHSETCKVAGCTGSARLADHGKGGYCSSHYQRWLRHGDPCGGNAGRGEPFEYAVSVAETRNNKKCIFWPYQKDTKGYGRVRVGGRGKPVLAHRLICELAHGSPPTDKHHAAHNCGNGHLGCCNPLHLRWASALSNQRDRIRHGTSNHGAKSGTAKLTEEQVREIRSLIGKYSQQKIANIYGVSQRTISLIKCGRTWSGPPPSTGG